MDSLITIPLSVMLTILFLIVVLLCFNAFTFYKWSALIEEYETLERDFIHVSRMYKAKEGTSTFVKYALKEKDN